MPVLLSQPGWNDQAQIKIIISSWILVWWQKKKTKTKTNQKYPNNNKIETVNGGNDHGQASDW